MNEAPKLSERQVQRAIELPFPHKYLWPNGRTHWRLSAPKKKLHREWARLATLAAYPNGTGGTVNIVYTVYAKPRGPFPDYDNTLAAMKSYQDGIADALGLNDRHFRLAKVVFGGRCDDGKVVVSL